MNIMKDSYGRRIDYLRVSITDRCNLRCVYCMPEEGAELVEMKELLSYEEIIRVCAAMADLGLKKIKITGGEPLVRKDVDVLVRKLKALPGVKSVTLTTNGVLLAEQMQKLSDAGIDAITISLDSMQPGVFSKITRSDAYEKVMKALQMTKDYPHINFKLNCVPVGVPGQDLIEMARIAKDYPMHVRFIEMMPIGIGGEYPFISEADIMEMLENEFGKAVPYKKVLGNGPCRYFAFEGFKSKIGFISAMSHKFCSSCNRVRLTSTGFLKTCLQFETGKELKSILRSTSLEEPLKKQIAAAIQEKPGEHHFLEAVGEEKEQKTMSQIGG